MAKNRINHLFITANISLILIAFFIAVASDKTDVLIKPKKIEGSSHNAQCNDILKNGLSLAIKTSDRTIAAINNDNATIEDILEVDSITTLKNAAKCLGRSPLEVNLDELSRSISSENDYITSLKAINKITALLEKALGSSTTFKNIDLKVVTNIDLGKNE